jgi:uncharacterized protein (TIGR03067 family)
MRLLLVLVAGFLAAAPVDAVAIRPPNKKTPAHPPADNLQGTWEVVSLEFNGNKIEGLTGKNYRVTITAGKIISMQMGKTVSESSYKIDHTKQPKQIVSTDIQGPQKGKVAVMIYSLEGDLLKLGATTEAKQPPKGFGAKDCQIVIVFKRQKG